MSSLRAAGVHAVSSLTIGQEEARKPSLHKTTSGKDNFARCLPVLIKPINKECLKSKTDTSKTHSDAATGQKRRSLRYDSADSSDR